MSTSVNLATKFALLVGDSEFVLRERLVLDQVGDNLQVRSFVQPRTEQT